MAMFDCCMTMCANSADIMSSRLVLWSSPLTVASLMVSSLPLCADLSQQKINQPPQTTFYIHRFQDGLPLDRPRQDRAGYQIGRLLGISDGIQITKNFFRRKRWRRRIGRRFFGAHHRRWKRQPEFDPLFEQFAH